MRLLLPVAVVLGLAACNLGADPRASAQQCLSAHAGGRSNLSAFEARQVVSACEKEVRALLEVTMRNACNGPCDYADPSNVAERRERKRLIEEQLMMSVTDEVYPSHVRM